jgi:hypothetical protein
MKGISKLIGYGLAVSFFTLILITPTFVIQIQLAYASGDGDNDGGDIDDSDSGTNNNGGSSDSGYSVTVSIGSHPFGNEWSYIWVKTEDGYRDNIRLQTAGDPSYTFDIPPGYGDSIQVCASSAIVAPSNCRTFSAGEDIDVELEVEGLLD